MKKMLLAATAAAFSLTAAPAIAEEAALPDADPAMWIVEDEDTKIYLFGTFHMLDGKRAWFNDEVKTAFDASEELVLEARLPENMADLQPLVMRYAIDPEGRTLSSRLSDEQNRKLEEILTGAGVPKEAFDRFEPWFVAMTLSTLASQKLGISAEHGPETVLTAAARERELEIGELEGFDYQLRLLDEMPEEQQVAQLNVAIEKFGEISEELAPMLAAWSDGEVEKLVEIMNESMADYPELYELLFTKRNANWAEWVEERLDRPGTVFVAVGAGHLAGDDSVQALLDKRGIASERVAAE